MIGCGCRFSEHSTINLEQYMSINQFFFKYSQQKIFQQNKKMPIESFIFNVK